MLTFNLHIGDWWKSTAHLSDAERGIYLTLLLRYYDTEQPLPAEKPSVYRLACARTADAMLAVDVVLGEFFDLQDDGWHNKRADEEIAAYRDKSAKAKRSAEARWNGSGRSQGAEQPQCEGNANALRPQSGGNANHEPLTNNQVSPTGDTERDARSVSITAKHLVAQHGVDPQVAADFLKTRKAKRLPLTQTALDGLIREFTLANLSTAAGIHLCTKEGWAGFKHTWPTGGGTNAASQSGGRHRGFEATDAIDDEWLRNRQGGGRIVDAG